MTPSNKHNHHNHRNNNRESAENVQETALLSHIIYRNDDDFLIGKFHFKSKNGNGTSGVYSGKGVMINPEPGLEYLLSGKWEPPRPGYEKYGKQFSFSSARVCMPSSTTGIYRYLVRTAKWVGPTVGNRLVDRYGQNTLEVLKSDPDRVSRDIKGLTKKRADEIAEKLIENEKYEAAAVALEAIFDGVPGVRKSIVNDLVKDFGNSADEQVKENPYLLIGYFMIGFPTADLVAMKIGVDQNSVFRQQALVVHCLMENEAAGNIWIPERELKKMAFKTVVIMRIDDGIEALKKSGILAVEEVGGIDDGGGDGGNGGDGGYGGSGAFLLYGFSISAKQENDIARIIGRMSQISDNQFYTKKVAGGCGGQITPEVLAEVI